jgi:tetratricopeptide (TPR) repeat protein|tara:strand:+ start:467 stop:1576 length:1110 start_codon:yes stop_codon:yes gene_type:complete
MVIKKIREALEKRRQRRAEEVVEQNQLESYRENEQMQKAEQLKKEADRLAHLKQYKTAIDEYNKALEIYPFNEKEAMFKKPAEFFFKIYYNLAASYSFLNKFDKSIEYFDNALKIENIDDENRTKALMSKGNCYYRTKQFVKGDYEEGAYKIRMESDFDVDEKTMETFKKLDEKEGLFNLAWKCFNKTTELDRNNADAWYKKGHMEFLMTKVKEAMLSFDNVFEIQGNYENKEGIDLFEDIRMEKGIKAKHSKILETDMKFKTKTGHYVRSKAEKMIANFLFESNLIFQYNMAISWADKDDFKATFFIPKLDLYIEHFKFNNVKNYEKLMKWKIKQYDKKKKKLVCTTSEDEANIEETLKIKLKPYIVL